MYCHIAVNTSNKLLQLLAMLHSSACKGPLSPLPRTAPAAAAAVRAELQQPAVQLAPLQPQQREGAPQQQPHALAAAAQRSSLLHPALALLLLPPLLLLPAQLLLLPSKLLLEPAECCVQC
jgi:hypothetical protein